MLPYLIKSKLEAKVDKSFMSSLVKICGRGSIAMSRGTHASQKKSSGSIATTSFDISGKVVTIDSDPKLDAELKQWEVDARKNTNRSDSTSQASDNASIIKGIAYSVREEKDEVIAVRANGKLQAAATVVFGYDHVYIDYLATSPRNISLPGRPAETKGAGTAAIAATVQTSIKNGFGGKVKLAALPGAVSFYEKLGFTKDPKSIGLPSMTLSSSAAKQFLADYKQ